MGKRDKGKDNEDSHSKLVQSYKENVDKLLRRISVLECQILFILSSVVHTGGEEQLSAELKKILLKQDATDLENGDLEAVEEAMNKLHFLSNQRRQVGS